MRSRALLFLLLGCWLPITARAQTNPLWGEQKIKNYLPHMTWTEVRDLLTRTDIALIPVPSLEQHGPHAPIGSDFYTGVERAKLIAQRTDILVAPILFVGQAAYHMDFPGSITLSAETLQRVYFEAAQSLIRHGFRRLLFYNSHIGNQQITRFVVDRINQETPAVALDLNDAITAVSLGSGAASNPTTSFDRHAGVVETSIGLYLFPTLLDLSKAEGSQLTLPPPLSQMLPQVIAGDPVATLIFLAEGLKPRETGKQTSAAEMSVTGVWSERNPGEATLAQGRQGTENFVDQVVRFIERWKQLRPVSAQP